MLERWYKPDNSKRRGTPKAIHKSFIHFVRIHQRLLRYEALVLFIRDAVVNRDIGLRTSHKYNIKLIAVVMSLG
jgi:hypothetical protein